MRNKIPATILKTLNPTVWMLVLKAHRKLEVFNIRSQAWTHKKV